MALAQLCHRDALISGPVAWLAAVRMLHVSKYSVDTRVWIAVIPCGGNGMLVGNECCRCRDIIQASLALNIEPMQGVVRDAWSRIWHREIDYWH